MPWVATDMDGEVWLFRDEPKLVNRDTQYDVEHGPSMKSDGLFIDPPAPGEKREFRWADVVATEPPFRPGDVVRLKSGGPEMTVVGLKVGLVWSTGHGAATPEVLEHINKAKE